MALLRAQNCKKIVSEKLNYTAPVRVQISWTNRAGSGHYRPVNCSGASCDPGFTELVTPELLTCMRLKLQCPLYAFDKWWIHYLVTICDVTTYYTPVTYGANRIDRHVTNEVVNHCDTFCLGVNYKARSFYRVLAKALILFAEKNKKKLQWKNATIASLVSRAASYLKWFIF